MFKLSPSTDAMGVTTMGEIEVAPALIVRRFGPPAYWDGYKVSGQYVFTDQKGKPFVVHDWKSTSLWEAGYLTPDEFWASDEPQELCISTHDLDTAAFKQWFFEQLG
ncbi:MAG TPA: hypothetical protein VG122_03070 [Gemmata sp.]|jgi:hypothetical protein|nr:hypothetical protein [Gemmata sp.]